MEVLSAPNGGQAIEMVRCIDELKRLDAPERSLSVSDRCNIMAHNIGIKKAPVTHITDERFEKSSFRQGR